MVVREGCKDCVAVSVFPFKNYVIEAHPDVPCVEILEVS